MKATHAILAAGAAVVFATAAAAQGGPPGSGRLDGEIVQVRESQATRNQGALTEIQVRTNQAQEQWVRLGPAAEMGHLFREGDRVRVKTMAGSDGGPALARKVHNFGNGTILTLRDASGALLTQDRIRQQLRDGTADGTPDRTRQRDRIHDPGTGGGNGGGHRHGGGGGGCR